MKDLRLFVTAFRRFMTMLSLVPAQAGIYRRASFSPCLRLGVLEPRASNVSPFPFASITSHRIYLAAVLLRRFSRALLPAFAFKRFNKILIRPRAR